MNALEWTGLCAGGGFGLVACGYVFVSFAVAHAHHTTASAWSVCKQALRELLIVLVSQPMLLPYFIVGRRMGGNKAGTPIVLVHGYFQNRGDFVYVAHFLRRRGLGPLYGLNYWTFGRIESAAAQLARFVQRVRAETGAAHVDLVCHSLGGLVANEYLRKHSPAVRRVATLASPHAGVAWPGPIVGKTARTMRQGSRYLAEAMSDPFGVPVLSVYSTWDNVVYPPKTSELAHRGGVDLALDSVGHLAILFDRRAADAVADFLASP